MTAPAYLALALAVLAAGAPLVLLVGLFDRRAASGVATLAAAAAAVLAVSALGAAQGSRELPVLRTLPPGIDDGFGVAFPSRIASTPTTLAIALTVLGVVLAVQVYAGWYLRSDQRQPAFMATVSLFAAAMLLLVTSRDLVLTLVSWEVMGWCSYLLIGFWYHKPSACAAAIKAFVVNRVGDFGFSLGILSAHRPLERA